MINNYLYSEVFLKETFIQRALNLYSFFKLYVVAKDTTLNLIELDSVYDNTHFAWKCLKRLNRLHILNTGNTIILDRFVHKKRYLNFFEFSFLGFFHLNRPDVLNNRFNRFVWRNKNTASAKKKFLLIRRLFSGYVCIMNREFVYIRRRISPFIKVHTKKKRYGCTLFSLRDSERFFLLAKRCKARRPRVIIVRKFKKILRKIFFRRLHRRRKRLSIKRKFSYLTAFERFKALHKKYRSVSKLYTLVRLIKRSKKRKQIMAKVFAFGGVLRRKKNKYVFRIFRRLFRKHMRYRKGPSHRRFKHRFFLRSHRRFSFLPVRFFLKKKVFGIWRSR